VVWLRPAGAEGVAAGTGGGAVLVVGGGLEAVELADELALCLAVVGVGRDRCAVVVVGEAVGEASVAELEVRLVGEVEVRLVAELVDVAVAVAVALFADVDELAELPQPTRIRASAPNPAASSERAGIWLPCRG
jgi:hypothetical protein